MLRKNSTVPFIFLGYVVLWTLGHIYVLNIHCFILSFSRGEIVKLENIFWNNSILRKCDLIPNVLPMKIWKILQLTKSDKGNRLKEAL